MQLQFYRGTRPNFGDELNQWLWPQLLPSFFDNDPTTLFIGIGSILGASYDSTAKKIVAGAGYVSEYHHEIPNVHGEDWDILFVRGPRTARALGLPETMGIGDPAILLRALNFPSRRDPRHIGFMPHWESLSRGRWSNACDMVGIRLIDPCAPVEQVLTQILECELLVTEAMHGAIVADALRVPWVPALPIDYIHRQKWLDWAESMSLDLKPHLLWPSSLAEAKMLTRNRPFFSKLTAILTRTPITYLAKPIFSYSAALRLYALAKKPPLLSRDSVIGNAVDKILSTIRVLQIKYGI